MNIDIIFFNQFIIQCVGTMSNGSRAASQQQNNSSSSSSSSRVANAGAAELSEALALLPRYLTVYVSHYHDDFYIAKSFDPRLIAQLMSEGFLPIAGSSRFLLPKLHIQRCVLQLRPTSKLHISRSTRKKSKRFSLSINKAFNDVVRGCHKQHGINWLFPPIVSAFRSLQRETIDSGGYAAHLVENDSFNLIGTVPVRFYSVEIWNATTGMLAGGELGYSVGGIYTSLTGFSNEDAAGSVQLAALGKLLLQCGFSHWDLGMEMEYKLSLGADLVARSDFVREVHRTRVEDKDLVLRCNEENNNCKEIIDFDKPDSSSETTKPKGAKHELSTQNGGAKKRPHKDNGNQMNE